MVTSITLRFAGRLSGIEEAAVLQALQLTQNGSGLVLGLQPTLDATGTQLTLTFTGGWMVAGSLPDGRYTLTMTGVSQPLLDGTKLFRLYGDVNGDGTVDATDLAAFQKAYRSHQGYTANYVAYLDCNGDGWVDATDYSQFLRRYGTRLPSWRRGWNPGPFSPKDGGKGLSRWKTACQLPVEPCGAGGAGGAVGS
jgi:hypothetical protein